ncbi:MAG TPA: bifunctional [glutamine synthetase] adenylyltransferase/[glutamine synthetase]-adenylyl-L-tyrosine phosphorylase [Methyloceanibacter sp.]
MTPFHERITECPLISDENRARDVLDTLTKPGGTLAELIEGSPKVRTLLEGAFSSSSYLASLALRDPNLLAECLSRDPDEHLALACTELAAGTEASGSVKEVSTVLRRFKRSIALLAGLADLGGVWEVDVVVAAMSKAAEAALNEAVAFLFRKAQAAGEIEEGVAPGSGYIVIAMGKLGASELNYSSDIDLIVFYDTKRAGLKPAAEPSAFFVKITRDLVKLLQEHTGEGYVFRTDLRLRPDPGATQIALSTEAALSYYESFGQNWERAALIKAKAAAGDRELGEAFLRQLSPFIWRKYLDYAAVDDIHAMKRRVHDFKGHGAVAVEGHDIKLGRGGIRDIEFFVQTQQLITGGRHQELRTRGTIETLFRLAEGGWIAAQVAADLSGAYRFLRRIENRLQMIGDEQTHSLPTTPEDLLRVARLSGFETTDVFADALLAELRRVEMHYGALFERLPQPPASAPSIIVTGAEAEPATLDSLKGLGYTNPTQAIETVRAWQSGRYAATKSTRARERLTEFLPHLLDAFGRTAEPDLALANFDRVMASMPAGVQLFSLLAANPSLTRLIADIMGTAPRLAQTIARQSRLLDVVLDPGFFEAVPAPSKVKALIERSLEEASDYSEALDRARIVGREQAFLIGVRVLSGTITAEQAGAAYATVAAGLIEALLPRVEAELVRQHGRIDGGRAAVLAMGKLGGREMTASSDLDLIVIYDFKEGAQSDGARSLPAAQYFARLTQRLIAALSAPTAEGSLYQVDMRLRPSGTQGPVATRLSSFIDYQQNQAWTWEHLALMRARVLTGTPDLKQEIEATISEVLRRPRDRSRLAADVREMRAKIEMEKGTKDIWDLKQVRGGLVDIEFLTQFLQAASAHEHPDVLDQNTAVALAKFVQASVLSQADAEILLPAIKLFNTLTQVLRLCLDKPFVPAEAPRGLTELLARASDMPDFPTLEGSLRDTLAAVHDAFERIVR